MRFVWEANSIIVWTSVQVIEYACRPQKWTERIWKKKSARLKSCLLDSVFVDGRSLWQRDSRHEKHPKEQRRKVSSSALGMAFSWAQNLWPDSGFAQGCGKGGSRHPSQCNSSQIHVLLPLTSSPTGVSGSQPPVPIHPEKGFALMCWAMGKLFPLPLRPSCYKRDCSGQKISIFEYFTPF